MRPVDRAWGVSSGSGPRWGRRHNGVDLAAPAGEPVLAADAGEVTYAGWEPTGFGYLVEVRSRPRNGLPFRPPVATAVLRAKQ